jgi:hypothetical protein
MVKVERLNDLIDENQQLCCLPAAFNKDRPTKIVVPYQMTNIKSQMTNPSFT